MSLIDKCILHIGCEKTGTSTTQRFLSLNRPKLKKDGVVYPVAGGTLYGGSQTGYPVIARKEPWLTDMGRALNLENAAAVDAYRQELAGALQHEIQKVRRAHTLIISSEHFHSRLRTTEEIAALRDFLSQFADRFEVIAFFRRQDRMAVSLYATHIKSGNPCPQPFLPALDLPETYYYRYDQIFLNWSAVFGRDAMRPVLFDSEELRSRGLYQHLCALCQFSLEGKKLPEPQNASLSAPAAAFLMEVNRQCREGLADLTRDERSLLIREIERLFPGKVYPFDRATAQTFQAQFAASNETFKQLAFPSLEGSVFDSDFSEYPEQALPLSDPFEGAVAMMLKIVQAVLDGTTSLKSR
jgi:hypothetical protein